MISGVRQKPNSHSATTSGNANKSQGYLQSPQKEAVAAISGTIRDSTAPTIVVSPDGRALSKCFEKGTEGGALYKYAKDVTPFLNPTNLPKYAAKFDTIMKCITDTSGIVFVYSNLIRGGVLQFAMALEESGFEPAIGQKVLETIIKHFH